MRSTTAENEVFATSDFPLAVTLAVWFPVLAIDRSDPRRARFEFRRSAELEEAIDEFHQDVIRIEPKSFYLSMKALKGRLYG